MNLQHMEPGDLRKSPATLAARDGGRLAWRLGDGSIMRIRPPAGRAVPPPEATAVTLAWVTPVAAVFCVPAECAAE